MKYNRIIVVILMAILAVGTVDAQVSVRRQNRNKTEDTSAKPARDAKPKESAKPKAAKPASVAAAKAESAEGKGTTVKTGGAKKSGTTAKKGSADKKSPVAADGKTVRQRAFDEYQKESQEETPWQHIVYREIDLTLEQNASLYYPVEPQDGLENLFYVILKAYAKGELKAYEYLGDREVLTDEYLTKIQEMLDKFELGYTVVDSKDRNAQPTYQIADADIPSPRVLSYYVKERWEFDQKHSRYVPRILCICPVLHNRGESGSEIVKDPMFWINFEDLRPLLRNHLVVTEGMNQAARYSMEEFFTLYMYDGTIYKEQNLRGLTLAQQYPNPDSLKMRQKEIDDKLKGFGKQIWVEEEPEVADSKASAKEKKAAEKEAKAAAKEERKDKTGRTNRRTKDEVLVDSAAIEAKATRQRSVRR